MRGGGGGGGFGEKDYALLFPHQKNKYNITNNY